MIFVCSDWHFGHNKQFCYEARGFNSVEEMNEAIVKNHNSVVGPEDDVYCLGDCFMGEDKEAGKAWIEKLNGKIHIIRGNHCSNNKVEVYKSCSNVVEICGWAEMIKYKKYNFLLSHHPTLTSNMDADKPIKARIINLCGHYHTMDKFCEMDKGLCYHVDMDAHNCYPCLLDNIIEEIVAYVEAFNGVI